MAMDSRMALGLWSAVLMIGWAHPAARAMAEPRAPAAVEPASRAPDGVLPDSVLALVGTDRAVTRSAFADAWERGSSPSDSLTPETARRFLGLLIDRELLEAAAVREAWTWTAEESAQYRALRDRLTVGAALDSALRQARAASGDTSADLETLGIAVRDSAVAAMAVRFDEALVERLARAWSELPRPEPGSPVAEQLHTLAALPRVEVADTGRVVARCSEGELRVAALLDSWRRLSLAYRPRIETASQVRDLARNALFERSLRHRAEAGGLERRPDIAAALERARAEIAVAHLIGRDVYAAIPRDSLALLRYYRAHREDWALPLRVRVIRLVLSDRAEAARMAVRLRDPAEAESLAAMARRHRLDYEAAWSAAADSAWFAAALRAGVGAVLGPTPYQGDWLVARVTAIQPGRERRFDEVRDQVEARLVEEEAERRTRALCDRLRQGTPVVVNQGALRSLSR